MVLGQPTIMLCNGLNANHHTPHVVNTWVPAAGAVLGGGGDFGR